MQAKDKSFSFMATPCYYDIPFFQRAYVWNEDNWSELLSNLTSRNQNHFLGSIILKNELAPSGSVPRFSVIDGQQRLTTLSILLRACYDHIAECADKYGYDADVIKTCQVTMESLLFVPEGGIKRKLFAKINHSHLDKKAYENTIKGEYADGDKWQKYVGLSEDTKVSSIVKAYAYFRDELQGLSQNSIDYLWELLTVDKIKFLVNIDLDVNDNEQAIFDTVNSAGVRLSSADTIKNLLYQKYVELLRAEDPGSADNKAVSEYEATWGDAFISDEDLNAYWETSRQYGRLKRSNIEIFLHAFAVVKGFFNPAENNMVDLPQKYRQKISDMNIEDLEHFLTEMHDFAEVFRNYFSKDGESLEFSDFVGRIFNICNVLEVSTFYPYLLQQLYARKTGAISDQELEERFFAVEKYVILNAICKGSTKNYNNECLQMVSGKKTPQEIMHDCIYISEGNFVNGLRRMTANKLPTLLLFWIELYQRNGQNVDVKSLKYEYTLEHIMPQKWRQNWSDVPAYDEEGNVVEDADEIERIRNHAIYELGNMTLLNSKLNTSISNGTFHDKVNGKGGKKGIRDLADLRLTKEVCNNNTEWDERKIASRTDELEKQIRQIWDAGELPTEIPASTSSIGGRRKEIRYAFWEMALPVIREKNHNECFSNVTPATNNSVSGFFGLGGFSIVCAANNDKARVDIYLGSNNAEKNKEAYQLLLEHKTEIEDRLGAELSWNPAEAYKASWISYTLNNVSITNKDNWNVMADFLGEWSNKFREVIVPYLTEKYSQDTSASRSPEEIRRLNSVAVILRKWMEQNPSVQGRPDKSNRTYTRFKTVTMSQILPDIPNAPSGWNTANHYFYEITNRSGRDVSIHLSFSSRNLTDEQRNRLNQINELVTMHQGKADWQWWSAFKTEKIQLPDDLNEEQIFQRLNKAMTKVFSFEAELKQKLEV